MSAFPLTDWQFWIASLIAAVAVYCVVRPLIPRRSSNRACPKCPEGTKPAATSRKAKLTVEGSPPAPRRAARGR